MQETVFPRLCMPRGHLEVSGDIFGCCHWNGRVLLAFSGWGSGTLLNPQQRIGQPLPWRRIWPQMSAAPRLGNLGLQGHILQTGETRSPQGGDWKVGGWKTLTLTRQCLLPDCVSVPFVKLGGDLMKTVHFTSFQNPMKTKDSISEQITGQLRGWIEMRSVIKSWVNSITDTVQLLQMS